VIPGKAGSGELQERPAPPSTEGKLRVRAIAVGVCGTDREIIQGTYGEAPEGEERLILGHESLGRVLEAPPGSGFREGDWVVGIVRHPDPVPCAHCAVGEWDMCSNGRYLEHGIKGLHGFASEEYLLETAFAVKTDPGLGELAVLLEPSSIVAKAWEHIDHIGRRALYQPRRALITGAGPIGLLAALQGVQRGLEVHVLDRNTSGPKPRIVRALGAIYNSGDLESLCQESDVILECTGAASLIFKVIEHAGPNGIVCLTGVSSRGSMVRVDAGALNRELVLENTVVFGSVNANRRHCDTAARSLVNAPREWLEQLISRRVPVARWADALERLPGDVKTLLVFQ
jgi:glucose 1-dehydrogenase